MPNRDQRDNNVSIIGATIDIFPIGGNMNDPEDKVVTLAPIADTPGSYRADNIDEGNYFLVAKAAGRGTLVREFKLPSDLNPYNLIKNIGPLNMVAGLPVFNVTISDKDGADVDTGITLKVADIRGVHDSMNRYYVENVPVGARELEIVPDDPDVYQNYKRIIDITNPMSMLGITLNPPITLQVTINKITSNGDTVVDNNSRLFVMNGNDRGQEIQPDGNLYRLRHVADGDITVRAYDSTGVTPRGASRKWHLSYDGLTSGTINRTYIWTEETFTDIQDTSDNVIERR